MRPQRGAALLLVLWALVLLGGLAIGLAATTRSELSETRGLEARAVADALTEAALWSTLSGYDAGAVRLLPGGDGVVRVRIDFDGRELPVAVVAEGGKVDLNVAGEALLQVALAAAGVEPKRRLRLAQAILDWRDRDDAARPEGAEADAYRRADSPYRPRNAAFESIEELRRVLGMDEPLFAALAPFVTVHGLVASFDPRYADERLLRALPAVLPAVDPAEVELLLATRALAGRQGREVSLPPVGGAEAMLAPGIDAAWTFVMEAPLLQGRFRREALVWFGGAGRLPFSVLAWRQPGFALGGRGVAPLPQPAGLPGRATR